MTDDEQTLQALQQLYENDAKIYEVLAGFAALLSTRLPMLTSAEQSQFASSSAFLLTLVSTQQASVEKLKAKLRNLQAAKDKVHDN